MDFRNAALLVLACISMTNVIPFSTGQCLNSQWKQLNNKCIYWSTQTTDYVTAVAKCALMQARFPILKTLGEVANFRAFLVLNPVYQREQWLGHVLSNGQYVSTDDGTPVPNDWWVDGGTNSDACVQWWTYNAGGFDDTGCGYNLIYACEQGLAGQTEFSCALLQRYKFVSPIFHLATTFLITDRLVGNAFAAQYDLGNAYAATIQIPGVTQPLYQVTYGASQIMATDADLPTFLNSYAVNRVLAYLPLIATGKQVSVGGLDGELTLAYLLWDNPTDPRSSVLSTNASEVSSFQANNWVIKSNVAVFTGQLDAPKFNTSCKFFTTTTSRSVTTTSLLRSTTTATTASTPKSTTITSTIAKSTLTSTLQTSTFLTSTSSMQTSGQLSSESTVVATYPTSLIEKSTSKSATTIASTTAKQSSTILTITTFSTVTPASTPSLSTLSNDATSFAISSMEISAENSASISTSSATSSMAVASTVSSAPFISTYVSTDVAKVESTSKSIASSTEESMSSISEKTSTSAIKSIVAITTNDVANATSTITAFNTAEGTSQTAGTELLTASAVTIVDPSLTTSHLAMTSQIIDKTSMPTSNALLTSSDLEAASFNTELTTSNMQSIQPTTYYSKTSSTKSHKTSIELPSTSVTNAFSTRSAAPVTFSKSTDLSIITKLPFVASTLNTIQNPLFVSASTSSSIASSRVSTTLPIADDAASAILTATVAAKAKATSERAADADISTESTTSRTTKTTTAKQTSTPTTVILENKKSVQTIAGSRPTTAKPLSSMEYQLQPLIDDIALSSSIKANIPFAEPTSQLPDALLYSFEDIVEACRYNGKSCSDKDWSKISHPTYGNCYTFNYNGLQKYSSKGLNLILKNQEGEYVCSSESTGFKVMLHDPNEFPLLAAFGQNVASGYSLDLKISQVILKKVNEPVGRCIENYETSQDFYYPGSYTTEACIQSCYQRFVIEKCQCADPRYLKPRQIEYCKIEQKSCIDLMEHCETDFLDQLDCQCPEKCHSTTYKFVTSLASVGNSDTFKTYSKPDMTRRNISLLHFNYANSQSVSQYNEKLTYDIWALLADVYNSFQTILGLQAMIVFEMIAVFITFVFSKN